MPTPFPPMFEAFIAPARLRPQLWRLVLGTGLIALLYIGLTAAAVIALTMIYGADRWRDWIALVFEGQSQTGMVILLFSFALLALGPIAAARLLHRRRAATLFGRAAPALRDFVTTAGIVVLVFSLGALLLPGTALEQSLPLRAWIWVLPLALIGLLIQTGAEELVFRGYLLQQLAARLPWRLAWMVLPSLAFGALHYDPATLGVNAWLIVAATFAFGLIAADLTARTGTLGAAWGLHFANNCAAILFVSIPGPLSGLALYLAPIDPADPAVMRPLIALDVLSLAVVWLISRAALRR